MPPKNTILSAGTAYELWATTYDAENVVTTLENRAVNSITPALQQRDLLDAACGTGRRLPWVGNDEPRTVFGIDLVFAMIVRARNRPAEAGCAPALAVGDLRALPCCDACFDVVWCRLALGHLPDLAPAYHELARVSRPGGFLIISDFHPAAARAGHVRTFRDQHNNRFAVEHYIHDADVHERAARAAGLTLRSRLDCVVGPEVRGFYAAAGRLDAYRQQRGLPLVLVLGFSE